MARAIDKYDEQGLREFAVYGASEREVHDSYIMARRSPLGNSHEFVITSILSDVQELVSMGLSEKARKRINVVKLIVNEGEAWLRAKEEEEYRTGG